MATTMTTPTAMMATGKSNRGKDLVPWSDEVWRTLDHVLMEEMMRTRVVAKFLPHVHVDSKQTTVLSDVTIDGTPDDPALSIDEAQTTRINEFFVQWKLSGPQVEQEEHEEMAMSRPAEAVNHQEPGATGPPETAGYYHMASPRRASTAASLVIRSGVFLAKAEDSVLTSGRNALANDPLFLNKVVQARDANINTNLDLGLLNIDPNGKDSQGNPAVAVTLPGNQVIQVFPVVGSNFPAGTPPRYAENTLNAVAQAFSQLEASGLYGHYAAVFHSVPFADLHEALPTTLIEPVEPISHLVKAGIFGTSAMPPYTVPSQAPPTGGLPTIITDGTKLLGKVDYTGFLICLDANTVDLVRGKYKDNNLDILISATQKDTTEETRFRNSERFCLRLKEKKAVIIFLFMDQPSTVQQPPPPHQ
jgi:hypothetical protein